MMLGCRKSLNTMCQSKVIMIQSSSHTFYANNLIVLLSILEGVIFAYVPQSEDPSMACKRKTTFDRGIACPHCHYLGDHAAPIAGAPFAHVLLPKSLSTHQELRATRRTQLLHGSLEVQWVDAMVSDAVHQCQFKLQCKPYTHLLPFSVHCSLQEISR